MDQTRRNNLCELLKLAALACEVQDSTSDLLGSVRDAIESAFRKFLQDFPNVVRADERDEEQHQKLHPMTTDTSADGTKAKEGERKECKNFTSFLF